VPTQEDGLLHGLIWSSSPMAARHRNWTGYWHTVEGWWLGAATPGEYLVSTWWVCCD